MATRAAAAMFPGLARKDEQPQAKMREPQASRQGAALYPGLVEKSMSAAKPSWGQPQGFSPWNWKAPSAPGADYSRVPGLVPKK